MSIISCYSDTYWEGWFFSKGGSKLKEFLNQPGNSFCQKEGKLIPVNSLVDAKPLVSGRHELYRITVGIAEIILLWNVRTNDHDDCTVRVTLSCTVIDAQQLINYWKERLLILREIDQTTVANEEISYLRDRVINDVGQYSFDQLSNENALPDSWWRDQFADGSLASMGLGIQNLSVSYSAPSADVKRELEKMALSHEAALEKSRIEAAFEQKQNAIVAQTQAEKAKIEFDQTLSEEERKVELEKVKLRETQLRQETEIERMRYEKERLQLEFELAEIRNRPAEKEAIRKEQERFEQFSSQMTTALQTMTQEFGAIKEILNNNLTSMPELSLPMIYNTLGVSDSTLFLLGHLESKEFYSRFFTAQKERTGQGIDLTLVKACSRDISTGQQNMKMKTLRIDESLELNFCSPISGYATVINLGTSGRFLLQVPNAYVTPDKALVNAWERTSLPGPLLPAERLKRNGLCYYEGGPTGWEELIILVTSQPLNRFLLSTFPQSQEDSPFVEIAQGTMKQLMEDLSQMPEKDWTAGVLGFSVVP